MEWLQKYGPVFLRVWVWIWVNFPKGCNLLPLKSTQIGDYTKVNYIKTTILLLMKLINFLQNLSTVNFSKFFYVFKVSFILWRANLVWHHLFWWNCLFFQSQIFKNKKWNSTRIVLNWLSYVSFFLALYLTLSLADITFITSLLPQVYVFTTSYRLFHVPRREWWRQAKRHIYSKIMLQMLH